MPKILMMVLAVIMVAVMLWGLYVIIFKIFLDIPDKNKSYVAISFRQFKALYAIAPAKWSWNGDHIFYQCECIKMKHAIDWILFRRFAKKLRLAEDNERLQNYKAKLLKRWQEDINRCYEDIKGDCKDFSNGGRNR